MFLRAGYDVVLFDTQLSQLQMARSYILSELENMQKEGVSNASEMINKLTLTENLKEAVDGAIYVQVRDLWIWMCVYQIRYSSYINIILIYSK